MTPLTGMTARQAAEELRRRLMRNNFQFSIALNATDAEYLASLLDEGARDRETAESLVRTIGDYARGELHVDDAHWRSIILGLADTLGAARAKGESGDR